MTFRDFIEMLHDVLAIKLFEVGETPVTFATLITIACIVIATFWISWLLQRALRAAMTRRGVKSEGTLGAATSLLNYATLVIGLGIALQTAGIDLSNLFTAGALFAVALGFAMQDISQNFVAGVILLSERTIRPGDVLEVDGTVVKVRQMGIRSTVVHSRDGEDLIVPNSLLVQSSVKNYTLKDSVYRVRVVVGVSYSSNMSRVREVLEGTASELDWRLQDQQPQVVMTGFGDSSVNFEVAVWMSDPWGSRVAISKLHEAIWDAFQRSDITIAFPQLDVHLDPPVSAGLAGRAA